MFSNVIRKQCSQQGKLNCATHYVILVHHIAHTIRFSSRLLFSGEVETLPIASLANPSERQMTLFCVIRYKEERDVIRAAVSP